MAMEEVTFLSNAQVARLPFKIKAAQTNAQREIPIPLLIEYLLEAATTHAEQWGVGFSALIDQKRSWVLARLAIEMSSYPTIGDTLVIETWVESINRHFSARNFAFTTPEGEVLGYARTIWSIIDLESRRSIELDQVQGIAQRIVQRACPIATQSKLKGVTCDNPRSYRVRYSDIDLNRHVDSIKYIEHLLDEFELTTYDSHLVSRFEINYLAEALYDMELTIHTTTPSEGEHLVEIKEGETPMCRGKVVFTPRK